MFYFCFYCFFKFKFPSITAQLYSFLVQLKKAKQIRARIIIPEEALIVSAPDLVSSTWKFAMRTAEGEEQNENQIITQEIPILCGLPDDISLSCLAKIPRKYHKTLRCVSKRWRDLVFSNEWRLYREKHNLSETWIYALCRDRYDTLALYVLDPNEPNRAWKRVEDPPVQCMKRRGMGFTALGGKIYLMGGCSWLETFNKVYCYDPASDTWSESAPMPIKRSYFSCEAIDDKLYAFCGLGEMDSAHKWDSYNSQTNMWNSNSNPTPNHVVASVVEESLILDNNILIRCSTFSEPSHALNVSYELSTARWQHVDVDLIAGWRGPAVVIEGSLYVLDQSSGTKLMRWEKERREWVTVGRLSALLTQPPCQLSAVGRSIFVVGKGLSTVVVDVGNGAVSKDGVLVSSSIPKLPYEDHRILSCKVVSI